MFTCHAAILFAISLPVLPQSTKAELLGSIRDQSGLPVPAAGVELTNALTGMAAAATTGSGGEYQFLALPGGEYRLAVSKDGFAPVTREGIRLRVGDRVELDFELQLGDARQTIEVTAAAPLFAGEKELRNLLQALINDGTICLSGILVKPSAPVKTAGKRGPLG